MPIEYSDTQARLPEILSVEEAEGLLEWLIQHPEGMVDLADCTHLHAANLQVLLAAHPKINAWPADPKLAAWIKDSLHGGE
ncbi:hypothetical protein GWK36_00150 [Caldichromatium japonicum]|uniref:Uncharacterized protein n=1 Tax=Caldichromatium japonicum TaxID=2699430 RepID=A0A6G7V9T6_9GAMM|nr:hypothetical protein [Caldichromatium japonicum]QIK36670.1 hypothetical protein GWK36_00150 [Caldichromatium japonicum]